MDKSEIESYVKAGEIAKEIKVFARDLIKPGMKLIDIAEAIDAKILELDGEFAFPVNLSLNEIAAHFTPNASSEEIAEGILKVDIGVAIDGFIADCAISIDLTEDGEFEEMIELNEKILKKASDAVKVGMEVRDIGEACQSVMDDASDDFAIIKSLSGHALGHDTIHAGLTISNYRNDGTAKLSEMAFAVEPFVTTGVGDIFEGKGGGIYISKGEGRVRDRDARNVLDFVRDEYGTRPFCERWLVREAKGGRWAPIGHDSADPQVAGGREMTEGKIRFILRTLVQAGILYEYPVLIEKSRKPVSQIENTFLIANGEVVCTTG